MGNNGWKDIKKNPIPFDLDGYDEVTKSVLLTEGNEIWVGAYWANGKQGLRMSTIPPDEYGIMCDATHWQELPKLPSECEEITATCQERVDMGAKP
jgi:hypothetical protein